MADKYWIGIAGDLASDSTKWSTTSGGTNDTTAPVAGDIAHFDSGGNTNCTWDIDDSITITCDSSYTATITLGADISTNGLTALTIYGTFDTDSVNNYALTVNETTYLYGTLNCNNSEVHLGAVGYTANCGLNMDTGAHFNGGSGTHYISSMRTLHHGAYPTFSSGDTYIHGAYAHYGMIIYSTPTYPVGSTIHFTGATTQQLRLTVSLNFYNLEINKSGGSSVLYNNYYGRPMTVSNILTIADGTLKTGDSIGNSWGLSVSGTTSISATGTLDTAASLITLTGDVTNTGVLTGSGSTTTLGGNLDCTGGSISGNVYITSGSAWTLTTPTIAGNIETENMTTSGTVTVSSGYLVNKTSKVFDIWGSVAWSDLSFFRFDSENRTLTDGDTITVHSGATWTVDLGEMGVSSLTNDGTVVVPSPLTAYTATLMNNGTISGDLVVGNVKRTLTSGRNLSADRNLAADRNLTA